MNYEVLGVAVIAAICAFILKSLSFKGALVFSAISALVIISDSLLLMDGLFPSFLPLFSDGEGAEAIRSAVKILAIGYLFGICSDLCREMGEGSIAKALEVAGRVEIMLILLPFITRIIGMGEELV